MIGQQTTVLNVAIADAHAV